VNFAGILQFETRSLEGSGLTRFRIGDTLFAKITPCPQNGKVAFADGVPGGVGLGSTEFIVLSPKHGSVPRFVYHLACAHAVRGRAAARMEGSTGRQRVPEEVFTKRLIVPLPPPDEQIAITLILDAVDTALERARGSLAAARAVAASLIEEAVSGKVVTGRMSTSGVGAWSHPRLGSIPAGWSVERLGKLCVRIVDGTHQAVQTSGSGVPFLYVSCVREGRILWKKAGFITERTYAQISRGREPEAECVLYTAVGSYGNAALVATSEPFSFQRHIAILYPKGTYLRGGYLAMWLNSSKGKRWSEIHAVGNAQKTVTLTELGKLHIAFPPLDVQAELCDVIAGADTVVDTVNDRIEALTELKTSLMHDLLTGRVRVRSELKAVAS
jgi:type I restriction enzyme S subunit